MKLTLTLAGLTFCLAAAVVSQDLKVAALAVVGGALLAVAGLRPTTRREAGDD